VEKLKGEYADTTVVQDTARQPSVAELEKATANLGRRITVRQDGKGDFTTIQAAIDAAEPGTLIEIEDSGMYHEQVVVKKDGIILRGKRGCWPIISSGGPLGAVANLAVLEAPDITLQRLVIIHPAVPTGNPLILRSQGSCVLRQVILAGRGEIMCGPNSN
jgi:hypothetical protein